MRILLLDARKNSKDEFQRTKNDGEHAVPPTNAAFVSRYEDSPLPPERVEHESGWGEHRYGKFSERLSVVSPFVCW
jgi:hypothetical protein